MTSWFKRFINPRIELMDAFIEKRGLLLEKGASYDSSIYMENIDNFVSFAKRTKAGTIFKNERDRHYVKYFYIVNGIIVYTLLRKKVKLPQISLEKLWLKRKEFIKSELPTVKLR